MGEMKMENIPGFGSRPNPDPDTDPGSREQKIKNSLYKKTGSTTLNVTVKKFRLVRLPDFGRPPSNPGTIRPPQEPGLILLSLLFTDAPVIRVYRISGFARYPVIRVCLISICRISGFAGYPFAGYSGLPNIRCL